MMRQNVSKYLQLPGKGPESLLQDNKVGEKEAEVRKYEVTAAIGKVKV